MARRRVQLLLLSIVSALFVSLGIIYTGLLSGCSQSQLYIGSQGYNMPGHISYQYHTFTGSETCRFEAESGQRLTLNYDIGIGKGSLMIEVENPIGNEIWEMLLNEDTKDTVELVLEEEGRYAIEIRGDNAGGYYDIRWCLH